MSNNKENSKEKKKQVPLEEAYNTDELDRRQTNRKPSKEEKPKDENKGDKEKN
ncbi:hypothetical protein HQ584_06375 [Patescibacteria group bacterium]|nr:hypothetical protein [Patescibacteria group bacterium]